MFWKMIIVAFVMLMTVNAMETSKSERAEKNEERTELASVMSEVSEKGKINGTLIFRWIFFVCISVVVWSNWAGRFQDYDINLKLRWEIIAPFLLLLVVNKMKTLMSQAPLINNSITRYSFLNVIFAVSSITFQTALTLLQYILCLLLFGMVHNYIDFASLNEKLPFKALLSVLFEESYIGTFERIVGYHENVQIQNSSANGSIPAALITKYMGAIQANNQFELPIDLVIQKVTTAAIIMSSNIGGILEIPRLFSRKRRYDNLYICITDGSEKYMKSGCNFISRSVSPGTREYVIHATSSTFEFLLDRKIIPTATTTHIIFTGHSDKGYIKDLTYAEFTAKLKFLVEKTDNIILGFNTCYSGGFYPISNVEYKLLEKVRVLMSTSKDQDTVAKILHDGTDSDCLPCMASIGSYYFDTTLDALNENPNFDWGKITDYKIFGELEQIRLQLDNARLSKQLFFEIAPLGIEVYHLSKTPLARSLGVYLKWGHNISLEHYQIQ